MLQYIAEDGTTRVKMTAAEKAAAGLRPSAATVGREQAIAGLAAKDQARAEAQAVAPKRERPGNWVDSAIAGAMGDTSRTDSGLLRGGANMAGHLTRDVGAISAATLATGNPVTGLPLGMAVSRPLGQTLSAVSEGRPVTVGGVLQGAAAGATIGAVGAGAGAGITALGSRYLLPEVGVAGLNAVGKVVEKSVLPTAWKAGMVAAEELGVGAGMEGATAIAEGRPVSAEQLLYDTALGMGSRGILHAGNRIVQGKAPARTGTDAGLDIIDPLKAAVANGTTQTPAAISAINASLQSLNAAPINAPVTGTFGLPPLASKLGLDPMLSGPSVSAVEPVNPKTGVPQSEMDALFEEQYRDRNPLPVLGADPINPQTGLPQSEMDALFEELYQSKQPQTSELDTLLEEAYQNKGAVPGLERMGPTPPALAYGPKHKPIMPGVGEVSLLPQPVLPPYGPETPRTLALPAPGQAAIGEIPSDIRRTTAGPNGATMLPSDSAQSGRGAEKVWYMHGGSKIRFATPSEAQAHLDNYLKTAKNPKKNLEVKRMATLDRGPELTANGLTPEQSRDQHRVRAANSPGMTQERPKAFGPETDSSIPPLPNQPANNWDTSRVIGHADEGVSIGREENTNKELAAFREEVRSLGVLLPKGQTLEDLGFRNSERNDGTKRTLHWVNKNGRFTADQWVEMARERGLVPQGEKGNGSEELSALMTGDNGGALRRDAEDLVAVPAFANPKESPRGEEAKSVYEIMRDMGLTESDAPASKPAPAYGPDTPKPTPMDRAAAIAEGLKKSGWTPPKTTSEVAPETTSSLEVVFSEPETAKAPDVAAPAADGDSAPVGGPRVSVRAQDGPRPDMNRTPVEVPPVEVRATTTRRQKNAAKREELKAEKAGESTSIRDDIKRLASSTDRTLLADLREQLPQHGRAALDKELIAMQRDGELVLNRNDDPQTITPRDEAAKLMLGDDRRDIVYLTPKKAVVESGMDKPKDTEGWKVTREEFSKGEGVIFHGSPTKNIDRLEASRAQMAGEGIYFGTDKDYLAGEFGLDGEMYPAKLSPDAVVIDESNGRHYTTEEIESTKAWNDKFSKEWDDADDAWENDSDFVNAVYREKGVDAVVLGDAAGSYGVETVVINPDAVKTHRQMVKEALDAGQTVPPEVLADYPDLAPAPAPTRREANTAKREANKASRNGKNGEKTNDTLGQRAAELSGEKPVSPENTVSAPSEILSKKGAKAGPPVTASRELETAQKRAEMTQLLVDGLRERGAPVPPAKAKQLDSYRAEAARLFKKENPKATPEQAADFLKGKGKTATSEGKGGDDAGGILNPARIYREHQAKEKRFQDYRDRQADLLEKWHKDIEGRAQTQKDIHKLIEEVASDIGLTNTEIEARIVARAKARAAWGLPMAPFIDTTPLADMNRVELAQLAKQLRVPNRGKNEALRRAILAENARLHEGRRAPKDRAEQMKMAARHDDTYAATQELKSKRGSMSNTARHIKNALIDERSGARDLLRKLTGRTGKRVGNWRETAASVDPYASQKVRMINAVIFDGFSDKKTGLTGELLDIKDWAGKGIMSERSLVDNMIIARASQELAQQFPAMRFTHDNTLNSFTSWIESVQDAGDLGSRVWRASEEFFDITRDIPNQLMKEGLITREQYDGLITKQHYAPRQILRENSDAGLLDSVFGIDPQSGLHRLDGGSLKEIETNMSSLLEYVVMTTERNIANNRANTALYRLVRGNQAAFEGEGLSIRSEKKGNFQPDVPYGHRTIVGKIKGKKVQVIVPEWFQKSWTSAPAVEQAAWHDWFKLAVGAPILREFATGAFAPLFAVPNLFRDTMHLAATQDAYGKNYVKARWNIARDVWKLKGKDGAWQGFNRSNASPLLMEFLENGGGGASLSNLTSLERDRAHIAPRLKKVLERMSTINNWSETVVRLAHYEKLKSQGMSKFDAAAIARDRINFSQGGSLIRFLSQYVPYLGARVAGGRTVAQSIKRDWKRAAFMQSQIAGIAALKTAAIYKATPLLIGGAMWSLGEVYDMISDDSKTRKTVTPTFINRINPETGKREWLTFQTAVDGSMALPHAIGEQTGRLIAGQDVRMDSISDQVMELLVFPDMGGNAPIAVAGWAALQLGVNTFTGQKLWQGGETDDKTLEYNDNTHKFFRHVSKASMGAVSPVVAQRFASAYLNGNNHGWDFLGGVYNMVADMVGDDPNKQELMMRDIGDSIIAASGGLAKWTATDASDTRLRIADAKRSSGDRRRTQIEVDAITRDIDSIDDVKGKVAAIRDLVMSHPATDRKALAAKLMREAKTAALLPRVATNVKLINSMSTGAAQAAVYFKEYLKESKDGKVDMGYAMGISGVSDNPEFKQALAYFVMTNKEDHASAQGGKSIIGFDRDRSVDEFLEWRKKEEAAKK